MECSDVCLAPQFSPFSASIDVPETRRYSAFAVAPSYVRSWDIPAWQLLGGRVPIAASQLVQHRPGGKRPNLGQSAKFRSTLIPVIDPVVYIRA